MSFYEVPWKAFGVATVRAKSKEEAEEIVSEGCFGYDDIDFERNEVDGVDLQDAAEV